MHQVFDFLANTADGVFAVDQQQRIILWNRGAQALLGHEPCEALGARCYRLLRGRNADGCAVCRPDCEVLCAARRSERISNVDVLARDRDARDVWLNVSTVVVPGQNSSPPAVVHMFHRADRSHRVEEVVEQLAGSLARLDGPDPGISASEGQQERKTASPALTPREREILRLLASGLSTAAIAKSLFISPRTVGNHVQNALEKLNVHSRLEAVALALKNHLV